MNNLIPFVLGEEKYFCTGSSELKPINEEKINSRTWKCKCCSEPVYIEALDSEGGKESYYRLSVLEIEKDNYVYIPSIGFSRILATGKEKNGYYLAVEGYRKLTKLNANSFYLVLP